MVLAGLRFNDLIAILKDNGYEVVNDDFWEHHNRIIIKRDNEPIIVLQYKDYYKFAFVVEFLTPLGITPPDHCQRPYDQYKDHLKGDSPTQD